MTTACTSPSKTLFAAQCQKAGLPHRTQWPTWASGLAATCSYMPPPTRRLAVQPCGDIVCKLCRPCLQSQQQSCLRRPRSILGTCTCKHTHTHRPFGSHSPGSYLAAGSLQGLPGASQALPCHPSASLPPQRPEKLAPQVLRVLPAPARTIRTSSGS